MTRFVENVCAYISQMKIKQAYISMKSGINVKKLSKILTGAQDVTGTDMELIAAALGKDTAFFLQDELNIPEIGEFMPEKVAFYAGNPTAEQQAFADTIVELMENIDVVFSAKGRFNKITGV